MDQMTESEANQARGREIGREIDRFERLVMAASRSQALHVERVCDYGFVLESVQARARREQGETLLPLAKGPDGKADKDIGLTLMGITHGNEFAGAAILNELLMHVSAGHVELDVPVAFVLGNPWAARENKRFLERDLNRSFNRQNPAAREELRARDLTPVLSRTAYLVDFHQTSRESDRAFFIFPYGAKSFAFARAMAPRLSIVTHWGKPFSAEGMCTDEYVNSQGGVGVSLEVGQNGLDAYQIAVGVDAGLWALRMASDQLLGRTTVSPAERADAESPEIYFPEIYTWAEIMAWPEQGVVELAPHWRNFKDVAKGEVLGTVDGKPLVANHPGKMLFPKYLTREQQAVQVSRPTELCRLMRRITMSDLPK